MEQKILMGLRRKVSIFTSNHLMRRLSERSAPTNTQQKEVNWIIRKNIFLLSFLHSDAIVLAPKDIIISTDMCALEKEMVTP